MGIFLEPAVAGQVNVQLQQLLDGASVESAKQQLSPFRTTVKEIILIQFYTFFIKNIFKE